MDKATQLLSALRQYVNVSTGAMATTAVYITPAQQLRNAADEMERKDALLREIDAFLLENKE